MPGRPSAYLLVRQEPRQSMIARDAKFSLAMSSIDVNCAREKIAVIPRRCDRAPARAWRSGTMKRPKMAVKPCIVNRLLILS